MIHRPNIPAAPNMPAISNVPSISFTVGTLLIVPSILSNGKYVCYTYTVPGTVYHAPGVVDPDWVVPDPTHFI